jgi:hypothetical protein
LHAWNHQNGTGRYEKLKITAKSAQKAHCSAAGMWVKINDNGNEL